MVSYSLIKEGQRSHKYAFLRVSRATLLRLGASLKWVNGAIILENGLVPPCSILLGRIARAFSTNSLVNTMDVTAAIQYILTAAQSLGSQVYYKKSRMKILGLAGAIFFENEQA